ncbi:rab gdp dissociation inhibitor alpha [Naegleria gruberi]|uniref:Rab GDP dissociation inhibitor n=1 Tax=Naegleria gruberi TaxID=5762 RepID=D2V193_NAEGR|nr:rab gdp dissociation inhibitor alpha [Naegleria gruberi]EFC49428.1 rab gdp dissociation inhibitor alpha [Naegleria gruberi]|eukprot:XP_002682172.1 rab gdp dissociation inhibitor alpha [Naegleria gruberi strain NEG-M]
MNEEYDVIVLGTGLTECVISGLLSVSGKKVLHMDRNNYYGGESASLNLEQMYEKFRGKDVKPPTSLGRSRDYNIDLIPKFLMANGKLVKILRMTGVTRYNMEFALVEGSFVYHKGAIEKVPVTPTEVAKSNLLGFFEKLKAKKLLSYLYDYEQTNPKTHQGFDCSKDSIDKVFKYFGVSDDTTDFLGHAVALYTDDSYMTTVPAIQVIERMKLYEESLNMYGKSPYVYPMYGLGELPQVFARLCAVYGGTYMLDKPVDKVLYDESGRVIGVESEGQVAKAKMVVGDPSYFQDKVRKTGKVIRVICILSHPVKSTGDAKSVQIIFPQKSTGRKHDIYCCVTSFTHHVAPNGKYIAIVSTTVETENPEAEVKVVLDILNPIEEKFVYILDTFAPLDDGKNDGVFISKSYDATTHYESCAEDIVSIHERISGEKFDWNKKPPQPEEQ